MTVCVPRAIYVAFCGLFFACNAGSLDAARPGRTSPAALTPTQGGTLPTTGAASPETTQGAPTTPSPQGAGATVEVASMGLPARPASGQRVVRTINRCTQPVWVASLPNAKISRLSPAGYALLPGATRDIILPAAWAGRLWGRTGCIFDAAGNGSCETGDCGPRIDCVAGVGGQPTSLAEIFVGAGTVTDTYDVSLVDAFNLPLAFGPLGTPTDVKDKYHCGRPSCLPDLLATCPADLKQNNSAGKTVACFSACSTFHTDLFCCANAHDQPSTCPPTTYSQFFKSACPLAYSYAYDDHTSTYNCLEAYAYEMVFCPAS